MTHNEFINQAWLKLTAPCKAGHRASDGHCLNCGWRPLPPLKPLGGSYTGRGLEARVPVDGPLGP